MKFTTLIKNLSLTTALLILSTPVYGASLTVIPSGIQLDEDPINDFLGNPGDILSFTVRLDTTDLPNPLKTLQYEVSRSIVELELVDIFRSPSDIAFFPDFQGIGRISGTDSIAELTRTNADGIAPGTIFDLETVIFQVTPQVSNDGLPDRQFSLIEATDIFGNDLRNYFTQLSETGDVDIQQRTVPEPSFFWGLGLILGFCSQKSRKTKSGCSNTDQPHLVSN
ncbi:MAG: hypothetical protein QNJ32_14780 [Xenococcaceae cyanobacterium MO_167.B27]|nr:hypothetical protein [Xenococcaceae cyanobacterium MO_167.B27]